MALKFNIHYYLFLLFFFSSQYLQAQSTLTSYVNPLIGTDGSGNTFPGAVVPFGMVQLSPDNVGDGQIRTSGYYYAADSILGFSHIHFSGLNIGDGLDVSVMPLLAPLSGEEEPKAAKFNHAQEKASPGYYTVRLENGIGVELTTTERVGYHRYHFPENSQPTIRFDLAFHRNGDLPIETFIQKLNDSTLIGYRYSTGWIQTQRVYFAARTAEPIKRFTLKEELQIETGDIALSLTSKEMGRGIAAQLIFEPNVAERTIEMKVALSMTSTENALAALEEVPTWNFSKVQAGAADKWENELKKVQIKTKNDKLKQIFYTALYHTAISQPLSSDIGDDTIRYTPYSLKTNYRTLYPLYTITQPSRYTNILHGLLDADTSAVDTAFNDLTIPILTDALLKDWPGLDKESIYNHLKKSAAEKRRQDPEAVIVNSYYDYCIALIAKKLAKSNDYEYFLKRAAAYKGSFDAGRKYAFSATHDVLGLAKLYGEEKFEHALDSFYSVSPTFVDTTQHIPYMYNFFGKPWKTQNRVRELVNSMYHSQPDGYVGNEGAGQMSAWAVWSILGLYPANPVGGEYVIGSPLMDEATLQLKDGKVLSIIVKNNSSLNRYIQSVSLNGSPYDKTYILHKTLMQGGTFVFEMGPEPNKDWGIDEESWPTSMVSTVPVPNEEAQEKKGDVLEWIKGIFKKL